MSNRAFYSDSIALFLAKTENEILGQLLEASTFNVEQTQRDAWQFQITHLKGALERVPALGKVYFEFGIPRLGKRVDVLLVIGNVIFILEYKVGEAKFTRSAKEQVFDYALDLKSFHATTHNKIVAPVFIATHGTDQLVAISLTPQDDGVLFPIGAAPTQFVEVVNQVLAFCPGESFDLDEWERGAYRPTPTIVEVARALYSGHSVEEISQKSASRINLSDTSGAISKLIVSAQESSVKAICFVTGVPGAGKTLVGLNIATQFRKTGNPRRAVLLSGNGPLVAVLTEALARDKVASGRLANKRTTKDEAKRAVKSFIQNVHHYRDECLKDQAEPPDEHVAIFDEAQRAWNLAQTASFMSKKRGHLGFSQSEPEFLISCLDRHKDWAVVVCLVGGGQEINTGEGGIEEWIDSLRRSFPSWHIHISSRLKEEEYGAGRALDSISTRKHVYYNDCLHLGVNLRSYRSENVSSWVKNLLDHNKVGSKNHLEAFKGQYPIVVTRNLASAKIWLRQKARGSERYGLVTSSQAMRLKPHAIDVRVKTNPIHWFLGDKEDVRSSYYLEDAATEFDVQGLEIDWACVVWDGDFRYSPSGWQHFEFAGTKWKNIKKAERKTYLKNAYRVLLTRARQGMVLVVPEGDVDDPTRSPGFYDATFKYFLDSGIELI